MKFYILALVLNSGFAQAQNKNFYLSPEDQKYYKNNSGDGMNHVERMDSAVKEINKVHAEMAAMKAEIQELKKAIGELKQSK